MLNNPNRIELGAIAATIESIAHNVDRRRWEEVQNAFAARVVLDYGSPDLLLPEDIVARWKPLLSAFDATEHALSNVSIAWVDADLARVKSTFRATHQLRGAEGGDTWVLTGRYDHELVRTARGWKVSRMRMIPVESSGNTRLLEHARTKAGLPPPAPAEVRVEHLTFDSHGTRLVGVLRLPANATTKLPAVLVTGSWTTVKEQMPAVYAERLAAAGYAALTFDFRGFGESVPVAEARRPEDVPAHFESPSRKVEDIRAAVDALSNLDAVDAQRIGLVAVCASSGYAAVESADDARVRSLVFIAPWLHDGELVRAIYGGEEGVKTRTEAGLAAEREYRETQRPAYVPAASATDTSAAMGNFEYYLSARRAGIPQWGNRFAVMSWPGWLGFDAAQIAAARIRAPTRFVHSEAGAVPDGVRRFASRMVAPHDIQWLTGPSQFDFYDDPLTVDRSVQLAIDHLQRTLGAAGAEQDAHTRREQRAVIQRFLARLEAFDIAGAAGLFAENGVQIMPYAPTELLPRRLEGRTAIRNQYNGMPANFVSARFLDLVIHDMVDPHRLFVTFRGEIELRAGGRYDNTYAGLFVFRGNEIIEYHEYFDPILFRNAFSSKPRGND
ncbi:alpha/beta fold hydrolase [Pendulispora rubella]|uniref:Alpha/beta fold hydrolase n=1 Tax=Pendulispora rubella TaxID=2741070 RepID=A0ABZ2LDZ6_9BACT